MNNMNKVGNYCIYAA